MLPRIDNPAGQAIVCTALRTKTITKIQSVTENVVVAIQDIDATIKEMNEIATEVASAVEEQRAATREIARSAQQASINALEVMHTIAQVEDAAATKTEANQVLDAASQLSSQSDDLYVQFNKFIAGSGCIVAALVKMRKWEERPDGSYDRATHRANGILC